MPIPTCIERAGPEAGGFRALIHRPDCLMVKAVGSEVPENPGYPWEASNELGFWRTIAQLRKCLIFRGVENTEQCCWHGTSNRARKAHCCHQHAPKLA